MNTCSEVHLHNLPFAAKFSQASVCLFRFVAYHNAPSLKDRHNR